MNNTFSDSLSKDSHRIWQASRDIIASRDTALLEELRAALPHVPRATVGIDLGGFITPDSVTLDHAFTEVSAYRSWRCWCDDYPRPLHFPPNREQQRGQVSILGEDTTYRSGSYVTNAQAAGATSRSPQGKSTPAGGHGTRSGAPPPPH